MRRQIRILLFLDGATPAPSVRLGLLELAAESGFRAIWSHWRQCDLRGDSVLLRNCREINGAGRVARLPGVLRVIPALVAVLSLDPVGIARGREIVAASGAFWAHCSSGAREAGSGEDRETVREPDACVSFGVAEFSPATDGALRLVLGCPLRLVPLKRNCDLETTHPHVLLEAPARQAVDEALSLRGNELGSAADPILHRTLAPCTFVIDGVRGDYRDPLTSAVANADVPIWREMIRDWLCEAFLRSAGPEALTIPELDPLETPSECECTPERFSEWRTVPANRSALTVLPTLFATPVSIETVAVDVSPHYLHPNLDPTVPATGESRLAALIRVLGRRRAPNAARGVRTEARLVEIGVGRACLVDGLRVTTHPELHDFTVLGVGMTPFSEGGFVEIGRKVDGKAALTRAWHRKLLADRLEAEGCRTGRVVAILEVNGEEIEMPDGNVSPAALVTRGFRCTFRVKQLDPIVMCLHSVQHAGLVGAYLLDRARELRADLDLSSGSGLESDDALARAIESQGASQESLRQLLANSMPIGGPPYWSAVVRQARLDAIDAYAPLRIYTARCRLANELRTSVHHFDEKDYLFWFAESLGRQLATWRRLRFLHDYHHPGVSRWRPHHLHTLGENNVTLMAEFPDLDTGVFVDDCADDLEGRLQLPPEDVAVLRERFRLLHQRDLRAAETVVRTLGAMLFRDDATAIASSLKHYWSRYDVGRTAPLV